MGPLSNTVLLGTTRVSLPDDITFCPTALSGCTSLPDNTHTYRQLDRPRYGNICHNRRNCFWQYQYHLIVISIIIITIIITIITFGRRLSESTDDSRETAFLFQRLSVTIQRFNSVLIQETFEFFRRPAGPLALPAFVRVFKPFLTLGPLHPRA